MNEITERTKHPEQHEIAQEVKVYKVTMPCSKCDGNMEFTGDSFMTYPSLDIHACNKCGYKEAFRGVTYPRIEYR